MLTTLMVSRLAGGVPAEVLPPDQITAEPEPVGVPVWAMLGTAVLAALAMAFAVGMALEGCQRGQFPRGLLVAHVVASALAVAVLVLPVLHLLRAVLDRGVADAVHPTQPGLYALVASFAVLLVVTLSGLRLIGPAKSRPLAHALAIAHAVATMIALVLMGSGYLMM